MNNPIYDRVKSMHPDWSEEQIWTEVSLQMQADNVVEKSNGDIDPNNPEILEQIVTSAEEWMKEVLPIVYEKVEALFHQLLVNIGEWVKKGLKKGLNYLFELLTDFFN